MNIADKVLSAFKNKRFLVGTEKQIQQDISDYLTTIGVEHTREIQLSDSDIPDFKFCEGVFAEVKIKGSKMLIYKQCERYCQHDDVKALILITNKTIPLPKTINGKRVYVINLSNSWL